MFEVSFTLKQKKNKNEPTLISLYSKINRKKIVLSTREKVKPRDWNFEKQRVREQSTIKGYRRINSWY